MGSTFWMDVQRAIRVVRSRAEEFSIDPKRVGVLGFSAGGHLAAMGSTRYQKSDYQPIDKADKMSCRPDFSVLVYAAYLNKENSIELGEDFNVDDKTPPAILIHTGDDRVSSLGPVAYYAALKKAKVSSELHIFPKGGHGYGLRPSENAVSKWPKLVDGWLKTGGWNKAK